MTGSERPSPEPLLKKEGSPAVLGGGANSGNALEPSNSLNHRVWGFPAVLSRGIPGNALRVFPGSFRNFFRNLFRRVPAILGVWPTASLPTGEAPGGTSRKFWGGSSETFESKREEISGTPAVRPLFVLPGVPETPGRCPGDSLKFSSNAAIAL